MKPLGQLCVLRKRCVPVRWYSAAPERNPKYARITPAILEKFAGVLSTPKTSLLCTLKKNDAQWSEVDASDLDVYNKDWMNKYTGKSTCVVRPKSTEEVSQIMRLCNENNIAVVPQGGNTGLVGGSVPVHDEVVLNLGAMNKVRSFDPVSGTLVCDAGCILEVLDDYVAEHGYIMPLDLGAKGSCHIGGNVATNAGGLRFLRYGSLHGNVLGVEVVLPNGEILPLLQTLRKDNTGLDLKQLFIGSEGSLGIITGVSIATPPRPSVTNVAIFGVDSYEAVQRAYLMVRKHCAEILSAFEFLDESCFSIVQGNPSAPRNPFQERHPLYVLIETSGSNREHDEQKLQCLLEELMESETISDGFLAQDESQVRSFWSLRESIPESLGHHGKVYKYDISIPIAKMYEMVLDLRQRFMDHGMLDTPEKPGPVKVVCGYGHIADGTFVELTQATFTSTLLQSSTPQKSRKYSNRIFTNGRLAFGTSNVSHTAVRFLPSMVLAS